jgi:hypothetical protein
MSVGFPCGRMLGIVSPMLAAPLSLDVTLGLVGVRFERFHGALHLPFLGGHRSQFPTYRELGASLLIVNTRRFFPLGHPLIIAASSSAGIRGFPRDGV